MNAKELLQSKVRNSKNQINYKKNINRYILKFNDQENQAQQKQVGIERSRKHNNFDDIDNDDVINEMNQTFHELQQNLNLSSYESKIDRHDDNDVNNDENNNNNLIYTKFCKICGRNDYWTEDHRLNELKFRGNERRP